MKEFHVRIVAVALLFICIGIPIIYPFGLPISVSKETLDVYNYVESLNAGDIIYMTTDTGFSQIPEVGPPIVAFITHCFRNDIRIVHFCLSTEGGLVLNFLMPSVETSGKTYGVDWVELGYFSGEETALASLAISIKDMVSVDFYGNNLEDLPLMEDVDGAKDISLFVGVAGALTGGYIRQIGDPFDLMIIVLARAANAPALYPYVNAGQVKITVGVRGGAEYEMLINRPGEGLATTDVISIGHLLVVGGIIFGNSIFLYERVNKKRRGEL